MPVSLSLVSHCGMIFRGTNSQASGFYHLQLDFHLQAHREQLAHRKTLQRERGQGLPKRSKGAEINARERESKKRKKQDKVSAHLFLRENGEML